MRQNENYRDQNGAWTRDNVPFDTYPCTAQEAIDLAELIRFKLRGDWLNLEAIKGVDLGLAARVLDAYHDIWKPRIISYSWWRRMLRRIAG